MSPVTKSHVFRNLAKYVRAGMGIDKACESLLMQKGVPKSEAQVYRAIETGVKDGKTIANSMAKASSLNELDFQMLDAAEKGGRLDYGLGHLSDYYERLHRTQKLIRRGMAYPIVLFHLALIITTFTVAVFSRFLSDWNGNPSQSMVQSLWDAGKWVLVLYFVVLIIVVGLFVLLKQANKSAAADRLIGMIPLLGKARSYAALERFTSVFEIFLLAGMKMDESLAGASKAASSGLIGASAKTIVADIRAGNKLGPALIAQGAAFPNDFSRSITAAEESGMLDVEFARWKKFYGESFIDSMDQLAKWVPKIVYFVSVIVMGFMIVRAAMAYTSVLNGILDTI